MDQTTQGDKMEAPALRVRCSICKCEWNNLFDGNNVCTPCIKRINTVAGLAAQDRDMKRAAKVED
jgi:hypothetical protein